VKGSGLALLVLVGVAAAGAPWLSPNPPDRRFPELLYAPPTRVHIVDGGLTVPFIYRSGWSAVSNAGSKKTHTPCRPAVAVADGLVTADPDRRRAAAAAGADAFGRDLFSRLLHASRVTLALALFATLGATLLGALLGAVAGYAGGRVDGALMRVLASSCSCCLPCMWCWRLRAALPLVVEPSTTFLALGCIFTVFGWPFVAKGRAWHRGFGTRA
jgi:peptide/nickel transport system permease protein